VGRGFCLALRKRTLAAFSAAHVLPCALLPLAPLSLQTFYAHLLCQFPTDDETSVDLDISEEALAAKNEKARRRPN
jgi:hypothetical protein